MENAIQIFDNAEFGKIRVTGTPENPLFCLADVCRVLELDSSQVMKRLDDGVVSIHPIADKLGRVQNANFVNEDGLYDVILDSRKPVARRFRKWVTSEVLPALRQHGFYSMHADIELYKKIAADPQFLIEIGKALQAANDKVKQLTEENENLVKQVYEMAPKASYYDLILQCTQAIPTTVIAKDYGFTTKKFNLLLHELGVQYKVGGMWVLYSYYADLGWTVTKTFIYTHTSTGQPDSYIHTYWTQEGRKGLYELLKAKGYLPLIEQNQ